MKKKYVYSSVAAIVLSLASYQAGRYHQSLETPMQAQENRVAYIESANDNKQESSSESMKTEELTPDEVSAKEGISAEQIVVKINDKGYVTSHGDHYHYYNGKVPFDAIISEELLMEASDYTFKDSDVVNEVKDGYIIKVNGQYYLYVKDGVKTVNVRTKAEIERQQKEGTSHDHKEDDKKKDDKNHTKKDKKDDKDNKDKKDSAKKDGEKDKKNKGPAAYRTDDGYVFSPTDVIDDLGDGFLVPHGDHFHFIPKKDLSAAERAMAQNYWNNKVKATDTKANNGSKDRKIAQTSNSSTTKDNSTTKNKSNTQTSRGQQNVTSSTAASGNDLSSLLNQLYALPLSQRHREADGLVFDPAQITKRTAAGVVVPHGDHFHFIPYSHMSDLERRISQMIAVGGESNVSETSTAYTPVTPKPSYEVSEPANEVSKPSYETPSTSVTPKPSYETPSTSVTPKPSYETPSGSVTPDQPTPSRPQMSTPAALTYFGRKITAYGKGLDGKPYDTSDGYVFSKASIDTVDSTGIIARHEDHFHYIGFGELEAYELQQVEDWVREQRTGNASNVSPSTPSETPSSPSVSPSTPSETPSSPSVSPSTPSETSSGSSAEPSISEGIPSVPPTEVVKPNFDAQKVSEKEERDGEVGYIIEVDGTKHFYSRKELDLTQISFAEQQLVIASEGKHVLDVVAPTGEELEPMYYLSAKHIKLHAANATYDTGKSFIIPHIDHIHVVDYSMLTKEEIASVKYIMQHPDVRPSVWTKGHEEENEDEEITTLMGTPVRKREGLANWQIIHFEGELETARKEGRYTTEEGYIFKVNDVLADKAKFFESTNQFGIPQADSGDLLYITKSELSEQEWNEAVALYKQHKPVTPEVESTETASNTDTGTTEVAKEDETNSTASSETATSDESNATSENSAETEAPTEETPTPETKKERAIEIFERVAPAKIIPVEAMPYNLAYAVGFRNGRIIVPHHDHYHNIVVAWFDDTFSAPDGYTLEQLFATVKYYIDNPDDRPTSDDGWGNSSPLANGGSTESQPSEPEEEDEEEVEEEEEDEFELSLKAYASDFGMDFNVFRKKLINIALANKVSMEAFSYHPTEGTVSFTSPEGETVTVSLRD